MCTDHQRNGHHLHQVTPTITRVPLQRIVAPTRWSRRRLLVSTGLGTASMAILAACGSSDDAASTPTTAAAATDDAEETTTTEAAEAEEAADESQEDAGQAEEGPVGELQLQHVSLGFVSAYVLVRGSEAAIVDT